MKCTIPEISWHNRDPVLSVDIQASGNEEFYRLASGGTDCHVLIWHLKIKENGAVDVDVVSDLSRHQRAVNVVRWSPSGQYLATGDDDANIIVWNLKTDNIPLLEGETGDKEIWIVHKILRGHKEDVYDICWSPNSMKLISGSIDNTAILWDITKGQNEYILSDHKGFVQGVTWDPKGQYIATLSSDRVCRVFDNTGRHVRSRIYKGLLGVPDSHALFNKEVKYFHDDTFKSYFRRPSFSPDGSLLITPSGFIETEDCKAALHATYIFTLDCLAQPAAILPSPKQVTIAVRCSPILYELHSKGSDPVIALPYRMVIAVATDSDVVLYDTQQCVPFAHLQKIHYTRITDLTWSSDGLLLMASSTDGFCTFITFEPNELGIEYVKEESEAEESLLDMSGCEEQDKVESCNQKTKEKETNEVKVKKRNILEQWAIRKPKNDSVEEQVVQNLTKMPDAISPPVKQSCEDVTNKSNQNTTVKNPRRIIPKRIVPTKIADVQKMEICEQPLSCNVNVTDTKNNMEGRKVTNKIAQHHNARQSDDVIIIDNDSSSGDKNEESFACSKNNPVCEKDISKTHKTEKPVKDSPLLKFLQISAAKSKSHSKREIDLENNDNKNNSTSGGEPSCSTIRTNQNESSANMKISDQITNCKTVERKSCPKVDEGIIEIEDSEDSCSQPGNANTQSVATKDYLVTEHSFSKDSTEKENIGNEEKIVDPEKDTKTECVSTEDHKSVTTTLETSKTVKRVPFVTLRRIDITNLTKDNEKECLNIAENSTLPVQITAPKTLRRIPLVTLSSPKRKKKE